jgi:hypothetical protein
MAVAQGPTGCTICTAADAMQKGTAFGVGKVLDPAGAYSESDWAMGLGFTAWNTAEQAWQHQPGAIDPAQVLNYSRGAETAKDDDTSSQGWDAAVDGYGVTVSVAAGNSGPAPRTINTPATAYNVIAVAAYCCSSAVDHSADSVPAWSSRGPTAAGRKKPDLVAPAGGQLADAQYQTSGSLWKSQSGTSYAAPQVAAGATLLAGAGIRDPKVVKAILIDSARQGRSGPGEPWGSQTGWQPDFGWGELDLDAAYRERLNFATGNVPANGARFFKATAQAPGDRATLVWHRRASPCTVPRTGCAYDIASGYHVYTLSNLDLTAYAASTGAVQSSSTSAIDNVEQVRTQTAGDVVYKVTAGGVDGPTGEPFALAATRQLTELAAPRPNVALTTSAGSAAVPTTQTVTVDATVSNPSPDLTAPATQATLELPPGVELVAGAPTQLLGTLNKQGLPGATKSATWTVRGTADGLKQLKATAATTVYGSTLTGSAASTLTVDAAGPHVTLTAPAGTTRDHALNVVWGGTDPAGVASYDVEVSLNGAPYTAWISATTAASATYVGSPGNRYRFRVRARDGFGNVSPFIASDHEIEIAAAPPTGGATSKPPPSARQTPDMRLVATTRKGRYLRIRGLVAIDATGEIAIASTARGKTGRYAARIRSGSFQARLALPKRARKTRLTLRYPGDARFAPQTIRLTVRAR